MTKPILLITHPSVYEWSEDDRQELFRAIQTMKVEMADDYYVILNFNPHINIQEFRVLSVLLPEDVPEEKLIKIKKILSE